MRTPSANVVPASGLVHVAEGPTGILDWVDHNGRHGQFVPDCRPEPAIDLLRAFQDVLTMSGRPAKEVFHADGINWFPTSINFLYWHLFRSFVKYRALVERVIEGELVVTAGPGAFGSLIRLLEGDRQRHALRLSAFSAAVTANNAIALYRSADVLFFRATPGDFRTSAALRSLQQLNVSVTEAVAGERNTLFRRDESGHQRYLTGWASTSSIFLPEKPMASGDSVVDRVFEAALRACTRLLSTSVHEYRAHLRLLKRASFRTLYSIDMTEGLYPLIYACQERGIDTVGHQHGAAYNPRHPSYVMEGFSTSDYRWFDRLITWGDFWRQQFLSLNSAYPANRVVVGSDLFGWTHEDHEPASRRPARNVLIPYEYLTNTSELGRYISALDELGYTVYFKSRPDEPSDAQLNAYCLEPAVRERVKVIDVLTPEVMESIDVVAGTCSTLLYQLLPWRRPTWIFDVDYRYSDDLVKAGQAHLVNLDDLRNPPAKAFEPPTINLTTLFGSATLTETLVRYVIPKPLGA